MVEVVDRPDFIGTWLKWLKWYIAIDRLLIWVYNYIEFKEGGQNAHTVFNRRSGFYCCRSFHEPRQHTRQLPNTPYGCRDYSCYLLRSLGNKEGVREAQKVNRLRRLTRASL